jgi:hypothetical protein
VATSRNWFETVAEAQRRAKKRVPKGVYDLARLREQGTRPAGHRGEVEFLGDEGLPQSRRWSKTQSRVTISACACPTTAATTSTPPPPASGCCPRSSTPSAARSRSCSTAGVRRGSDVVKALALGAHAVMIGRAYLWGMAAAGEKGVTNVLEILRSGVDEALLGLGRASVHDLVPDDLIVPSHFTRSPAPASG